MHLRFHVWQGKRIRDEYCRPGRLRCRRHRSSWGNADMAGVIALAASHDGPENPSVLVGECHGGLLPAAALAQSLRPLRDGIVVVLADQHDRLGTLYQQGSQVVVPSLGDAAQTGLAATRILLGRQPQPSAELGAVLELLEVADCGHDSRCCDDSDPLELGGSLDLLVDLLVGGNALVTSLHMHFELSPVFLGPLQHQTGHAGDVIAGVLACQ